MSSNVLSGGERALHRLSIIHRQFAVWLIAGVIGAAAGWALGMKMQHTTAAEWQAAKVAIFGWAGKRARAQASPEFRALKAKAIASTPHAAGGGLAAIALVLQIAARFGSAAKDKKHRRGSRLASAGELSRLVRRRSKPELQLCGVPLPAGCERKHILMIGTTGVGKSTAMRELLDQVRARHERAIVYDPGGHFLSEYARPGDVMLNPFDDRADAWTVFAEVDSERDAVRVAQSLVTGKEGKDEGFVQGGRAVLASLIWKLRQTNQLDMLTLYNWLVVSDQEELAKMLAGTPGARPLGQGAAEQASGMLAFAAEQAAAIQAYANASHLNGQKPVSVRRWVREGEPGSICWLPVHKSHAAEVLPLVSLWFDLAAAEVMSMGESPGRRLWFFADEVASLNRMEALPVLLAEGRKYGAAACLGFQNMAQLRLKYGRDGATALLDLLNTKLIFRTSDPEVAEYASKVLGEAEVERRNEGETMGRGSRDGSSLSQQVLREPLVMPSQLQNLPEFNAYMVLPGDFPHAIVQTRKRDNQARIPAFVGVDHA